MNVKKRLAYILTGLLAGFAAVAALNIAIDPFGAFGDVFFKKYGYGMTLNPKIGKIAYIDKFHDNYDSYIVGSSRSSSLPVEALNRYYGARFYNVFNYGADMKNLRNTAKYLTENYEVKNLILHVGISELIVYDDPSRDVKIRSHAKVSGGNLFGFYLRFMTLNPSYSFDKITAAARNIPPPSQTDVFLPESGAYNKMRRDAENVLNINDYVHTIDPTFLTAPARYEKLYAEESLAAIREIKALCDARGINFQLISAPNFDWELQSYDLNEVRDYFIKLADITEFWNFSGYNPLSADPRMFYDSTHYRNFVGEMMTAKIFNDESVYVPENFGIYTTPENAPTLNIFTPNPDLTGYINQTEPENNREVNLPILNYHHIVSEGEPLNLETTTAQKFKSDMQAVKEAGFTTIN